MPGRVWLTLTSNPLADKTTQPSQETAPVAEVPAAEVPAEGSPNSPTQDRRQSSDEWGESPSLRPGETAD